MQILYLLHLSAYYPHFVERAPITKVLCSLECVVSEQIFFFLNASQCHILSVLTKSIFTFVRFFGVCPYFCEVCSSVILQVTAQEVKLRGEGEAESSQR